MYIKYGLLKVYNHVKCAKYETCVIFKSFIFCKFTVSVERIMLLIIHIVS